MNSVSVELADIFHRYGGEYRRKNQLPSSQLKVMKAIESCRTSLLGGHKKICDHCGHEQMAYNSCRNRHCPKCQSLPKAKWLEARKQELLPVEYFHVVFTLPDSIAAIAFQNKQVVYDLLMKMSADTLSTIASNPKHLGAQIGCIALLHTWGQNLLHHPHVHCVVPGGGISPEKDRWISTRPGFFLPVRVLSRYFRNHFLKSLQSLFDQRKLQFYNALDHLNNEQAFKKHLALTRKNEWVVYAKPPFGGPEKVLDYLGRYTHRVAISNHRIVSCIDDVVKFRWRDYKSGNKNKVMALSANEFMRRFLLHVLPNGFQKIRHYGFLGNRYKSEKLALCRSLLNVKMTSDDCSQSEDEPITFKELFELLTGKSISLCPKCKSGQMITVELVAPDRQKQYLDSS